MTIRLQNLWSDVRPCLKGVAYEAAARLLKDPAAYLIAEGPTLEEAQQLLPTLRARAANAAMSGAKIFGVTALIERLEAVPGESLVQGYGVASPNDAGNFYFLLDEHKPVGVAIVRLRRQASQPA